MADTQTDVWVADYVLRLRPDGTPEEWAPAMPRWPARERAYKARTEVGLG